MPRSSSTSTPGRSPRGAPNRGPAAGPENRAALLAAAREVFAESGVHAPLNAVARRAGVGQGSLYRHFPDRLDLVVAVFEEQVSDVEAAAALPGARLPDLLGRVTRNVLTSGAFVDLAVASEPDARIAALGARVAAALEAHLPAARAAGEVRGDLAAADVLLAVSMVAAAVRGAPADQRDAVALRAWQLLGVEVRLP